MYKFLVTFQLSDHEMMEIFFINENDQEYLPHIGKSLQAFDQQPPYGTEKTYLLT
ncbi:hypothetical protein HZY91_08100 [Facklamia sp. DSM 111018]|uniref:Uncharacterized protein n=1 Tax=Facklamia lactis TaxID=2749967 RepID=A0ABS0LS21_9LACT|nr:hypothetical protein [Facklamia lactis]MBG9981036.1 hypothetical protein [Facklamia lactis]MBG9986847.1 hypothetical protein [Facklamia lactis]